MDSRLLLILTRVVVLGILVAGWLVGAVIHNNYIVRTGHGDITPGLIALGLVLFVSGAARPSELSSQPSAGPASGHSAAHS